MKSIQSNEIFLLKDNSLAMTDILYSPDTFMRKSNFIGKDLSLCASYRNSWKLIRISS